jgi:hypothetical protein
MKLTEINEIKSAAIGYGYVILLAIALVACYLYYQLCLNHIGIGECGVAVNTYNGEVMVQTNIGWHYTGPLTHVVKLSTLPLTVHVPSDAKVINTKIVRLKPEHAVDFVRIQGFSYTLGGQLENILMGYAFSGKSFNFLEVVQEAGAENMAK